MLLLKLVLSDVTPQSSHNGALSGSDNAVLSSQCGHNVAQSPESVLMSSRLSPCNTVTTGTNYPLLVDHVLSFIKAYRLKGDNDSLRSVVKERFSSESVETAKKRLWDSCMSDLEALGLTFHSRRDSDNRSQLAANLDDILQAFEALDSISLIPVIYCEALELLKLPPLALDPVAEQVQRNSQIVQALISNVQSLEKKLSSHISTGNGTVVGLGNQQSNTYATVASHQLTSPVTASSSSPLKENSSRRTSKSEGRESNLILFGLPEFGSLVESKASVDEVLEFLTGKPIPIRDMFRLGKYVKEPSSLTRPRPVLIKLCTAWDRKLILLQKRNLLHFKIKRLFMREDVPPEHSLCQNRSRVFVQKVNIAESLLPPNSNDAHVQSSTLHTVTILPPQL